MAREMSPNPYRYARKRVRVSQTLVAELTGKSRPSVVALEKGRRQPKADELWRLASVFRIRPESLMTPGGGVEPTVARLKASFRSDKIALKPRESQELESLQDRLASWSAHKLPLVEADATSGAMIDRLRQVLGLNGPPCDLFRGLYNADVMLEFTALTSFSGALLRNPERGSCAIIINSDQPDDRLRFTAAHEIAHLALGHSWREPYLLENFGPSRDRKEQDADWLAAELLMPSQDVWEKTKRLTKSDALHEQVYELAFEFQVSYTAMVVRLGDLRILPPNVVAALRKKKPSSIEEKLKLRDTRKVRFDAQTQMSKQVKGLIKAGALPEDWASDFDAETGPSHLRLLQSAAIKTYICEVPVSQRHHSVTEVYELVARWAAKRHPWAA